MSSARLVDTPARRPRTQERPTSPNTDALDAHLPLRSVDAMLASEPAGLGLRTEVTSLLHGPRKAVR